MKENHFLLVLLLSLSSFTILSQTQVDTVRAEYTIVLERNRTVEESEARCVEQARLKALADTYGYVLSEGTLSYIEDLKGQVKDDFTVLTYTSVQGEWLADITSPLILHNYIDNLLHITVKVYGKARKRNKSLNQIEFYTCSSPDISSKTDSYNDNQSIYCILKSAIQGFASIYYVDNHEKKVYRVYPYSYQVELASCRVEGDVLYKLFDASQPGSSKVDELLITLPNGINQAIDEVVLVFGRDFKSKPILEQTNASSELFVINQPNFEFWLEELRTRDEGIQVIRRKVFIKR